MVYKLLRNIQVTEKTSPQVVSALSEVESAVEVGLIRAGRLRQSVLQSAFRRL